MELLGIKGLVNSFLLNAYSIHFIQHLWLILLTFGCGTISILTLCIYKDMKMGVPCR